MARLLIIDDDLDFAGAAAKVLRGAGHEVAIELDPAGALASVQKRPPDLVILDVMFPEDASGGFKLAQDLRPQGQEAATFPILMLTAVNSRFPLGFSAQDIDDAWLPVDAFLEKPVDLDVLREKVAQLLGAGGPA